MAERSKEELVTMLRHAADAVEANDSFEGRIAWTFGLEPEAFEVAAFVRVGNSQGQGGVLVVEPCEPPSGGGRQGGRPAHYAEIEAL